MLDLRLPFDEPYRIPEQDRGSHRAGEVEGGRIVAIGTTVVRALESAANADGSVRAGDGVASGRIGRETRLRVVDAILTGVHQPGESHFELLRAFADDAVLDQISAALAEHGYRAHEFGDSMLIERWPEAARKPSSHGESFTREPSSASSPVRRSGQPLCGTARPSFMVVPDRRMSEHPVSARGTLCQ